MENGTLPRKTLILVGGGHAHLQVITNASLSPHIRCVLISESSISTYSGLLPAAVAKLCDESAPDIQLEPLCIGNGFHFIQGSVTKIVPQHQQIFIQSPSNTSLTYSLTYTALSLNVGSITQPIPIPTTSAMKNVHVIPTRPIASLIPALRKFENSFANSPDSPHVLVVGGGAAGLELSLAVFARTRLTLPSAHVTSITAHCTFAESFGPKGESMLRRELSRLGIKQIIGRTVTSLDDGHANLDDGTLVQFHAVIIATGAAPPPLLSNSALDLNPDGWISVRSTLQTVKFDNIFAVGDCVALPSYTESKFPPKSGVYAVRQGPVLTQNLRAFLNGRQQLKDYIPQTSALSLISIGDGTAIGSKYGIVFKGTWVFRLKMYIDESWQDRFRKFSKSQKKSDFAKFNPNHTVFEGSVAEAAAFLVLADEVTKSDFFDVQLSVLRRMDEDEDFRTAVVESVSAND